VVGVVAVMTVAAVAVTLAAAGLPGPAAVNWYTLPVLGLLLVGATWFVVPFRYRTSVDAVNLIEAALAPLLIAFPPLAVIVVAGLSQVVCGLARRLAVVKVVFNTAMWMTAAGLGAMVIHEMGSSGAAAVWPERVFALVVALVVVGLVNSLALGTVLALVEGEPLRRLLTRSLPVLKLGWLTGWVVNVAVGLLFALAYVAAPEAVLFMWAPLGLLHWSYRSYSAARADHAQLAAVHQAANLLAEPLRPADAIEDFLRALLGCFDAGATELVIRTDQGRDIHCVERESDCYSIRAEGEDIASLEGVLAASSRPLQAESDHHDPVGRALADRGVRTCLAAPLREGARVVGAVAVLDRGGFEGSANGELAIFEALARETTRALAKGRLLASVLEERRKLAEIVDRASDGICTFAADGTLLTWNPALERVTGLRASEVVGRSGLEDRLRVRTIWDEPVQFVEHPIHSLPRDLRLTAADGTDRHLTCSYSQGAADEGGVALVVIARDITPADEHEALRERFSQLVEADAARRAMVDQLQQTVVPGPIGVDGAEIAAAYEASDPRAPTGGDLYDWQVLPSGEVHIAVVDVLGHGVAATKDALAVVHTLRLLTAAGTPLEEIVGQADTLLRAQHPDLVATVMVARYEPTTGRLRIVSGGHPPALVVTPRREVRQVVAAGGVIGWPGAGSDGEAEVVLDPGDALVLYTDGLVEARKNILDGMDDLMRYAAQVAELPAAALARELVSRALAGAERRDDTLALVLRRDPVASPELTATWEFAPAASEVSAKRRALRDWLRDRGVAADDATAVAAELLANAVRAARERVLLRVQIMDRQVVLDVSDDGQGSPGLAGTGLALPPDDVGNGRGLYLVRALSERVEVLSTAEGSTIRAVLALADPSGAPAAGTSTAFTHQRPEAEA
jgi:PAS domain S-box-containing protein